MDVKFLFMDEKYADHGAPRKAQVTSLTGLLVPADRHREFRDRFYGLVGKALGDSEHDFGIWPTGQIHAANLLPDSTDQVRFFFLESLVEIVNDFDFRIFRVAYHKTRQNASLLGGEKALVETAFMSFLYMLRDAFPETQVWPIIESDRSPRQDANFAQGMQRIDYLASQPWATPEVMWMMDSNFGELFYVTKASGYGSVVDCVAYLLHTKWLHSRGFALTPYKERLAKIATKIDTIEFDLTSPLTVK